METITGSRLNHGVCRACLARGLEKFLSLGESLYQQVTIADILMTCVPQLRVELGSDELPEQICADCFHKLKTAYQFQQLCLESDKRLRAELSSVEPAMCTVTISRQPSIDDLIMNEGIALTESGAKAAPMDVKDLLLVPLQSCEENKMVYETEEVDSMVMEIKIEEEEIANSNEIEFAADPLTLHGTNLKQSKTNVENAANSNGTLFDDSLIPKKHEKHFNIPKQCFETMIFNEAPSKIEQDTNASSKENILDLLAEILHNQKQLSERLTRIEANMVTKSDIRANNKLLREVKVGIKKLQHSVCRLTGEANDDKDMEKVAITLPFNTLADLLESEEQIKNPEYANAMNAYFHKMKGTSEDLGTVIRRIFSDQVLELFNWEGRWGKRALGELTIVDKILRDVFNTKGHAHFDRQLKRAIDLSHHRFNQKRYNDKTRNKNCSN